MSELPLANVPVPLEVQFTALVLDADAPLVTLIELVEVHVMMLEPAFTVGIGVIVKVFVETAGAQDPRPLTVSVSVMVPAERSAALGV